MSVDAPSVLVVEDETAQLEVLTYNLEAEGFEVTKAETGDEALMLVEEATPDIILLDWMLPGVSGIEICRRLKANGATRQVPIIMLSARSEEVDNGVGGQVRLGHSAASCGARRIASRKDRNPSLSA